MTALLDDVDQDTVGEFVVGTGSERIILATGDFGGGTMTFEIARTIAIPIPIVISDLANLPQNITSNQSLSIGPIPVGTQIRAVLFGATNPVDVRADIF